ncbi:alcohol dehydrogenase catalytic domain-containing protein [Actinoplanes sp. NPDC051411]|uniref:alcohol dehydrogenase catalytic domain-containing protein n=1 Tax=Actinoplanes sp. NPDC051411 TaxID=3155522 RepID=UPI0034448DCC
MPEAMQAWEVRDGRLDLHTVEKPEAGGDTSVVRVVSAGVCASDVAKLTKEVIPTPPGQPWRPGHEIVGYAADAYGRERPVAINTLVPCGACDRCRAGEINVCPHLRLIGWALPGGFAPFVEVPRAGVVSLPDGLDDSVAVLADPMAVAVHGIRCGLGPPAGRLGVIGGGALGVASAAYAAARGWRTDVLVRDTSRLASVAGILDATIRPLGSVRPGEYDAIVDAAGGKDDTAFVAALDAVRDGGRIVVQTTYHPGVRLTRDLREPIRRGLTVVGSFTFCRKGGDDFRLGLDFLAGHSDWAKPYAGHRYPLDGLPQALDDLCSRRPDRPVKAVLGIG